MPAGEPGTAQACLPMTLTRACASPVSSGAGPPRTSPRHTRRVLWAAQAEEGVVPAELGGSDAPREMLDDDPELGSSVLGRTTGSDEPATDDGVDRGGGETRPTP